MISVSVGSNLLPPLFPRPFFLFAGWGLLGCIVLMTASSHPPPPRPSSLSAGWGLLGCMVLMTASSLLPHLRRWAFQPW